MARSKDLLILMWLLEVEIYKRKRFPKKRRHRWWVAPIWLDRKLSGEYHHDFALLRESGLFSKFYRMEYPEFVWLVKELEPALTKDPTRREPHEPGLRLAVCLRFLISGMKVCDVAKTFKIGVTSAANAINETTRIIWDVLQTKFIPDPTAEIWERASADFGKIWNFPQCCGAIDGKHVNVICPANSGSLFFNYKERYSIVLMAVCDAQYRFLYVNVGGYGSQSDGGTLRACSLGQAIQNLQLQLPGLKQLPNSADRVPGVLVGDEAFPLSTYLMRPYPRANLDNNRQIFNKRLSRARHCIENAFGILRQRFGIYGRELWMNSDNAEAAVKATLILHNILMRDRNSAYCPVNFADSIDSVGNFVGGNWRQAPNNNVGLADTIPSTFARNPSQTAHDIREAFNRFFVSVAGAVHWQNNP